MEIITFETKVTDIIQRTSDVKSFRFEAVKNIEFKAGQFFFVTIKINGEEKTKHFSFSNSPTENGFYEFTKRITDSEYSQGLNNLKVGDWARLRMPIGKFVFNGEYPKIAFLSGGIGITPIRSICKFVTDKKMPTDIVLLYGSRSEDNIVFRDDFDEMQKINKNIRVVHTLSSCGENWQGRRGHVDGEMIKTEIPDFKERTFYICGPPPMVESLVNILKLELNITQDKIKTENFTGY